MASTSAHLHFHYLTSNLIVVVAVAVVVPLLSVSFCASLKSSNPCAHTHKLFRIDFSLCSILFDLYLTVVLFSLDNNYILNHFS